MRSFTNSTYPEAALLSNLNASFLVTRLHRTCDRCLWWRGSMLKEARLVSTISLISSWRVAGSARLCIVTLHERFRAIVERTFGGMQRVEYKSSANLGLTLGPALGPCG